MLGERIAQDIGDADLDAFLRPSQHIASDDPGIVEYAAYAVGTASDALEKGIRLYYAVRDDVIYDPYALELTGWGLSASRCLHRKVGFCISKAALLAAAARAVNIPARVGYADVRNHLATKRLLLLMGGDTFCYHSYTEMYLERRWVKSTPAFNRALCERFRVKPLEFDGKKDSLFHPFDADDRRHMEYLRDRGSFADVPADLILSTFRELYPNMFSGVKVVQGGDFNAEAERENRSA